MRKPGKSKLVYDKTKRTIVTVPAAPSPAVAGGELAALLEAPETREGMARAMLNTAFPPSAEGFADAALEYLRAALRRPAAPADAVVAAARDARDALDAAFQPLHIKGCLWLENRRMPCQCGWVERRDASERACRDALRKLKALDLPDRSLSETTEAKERDDG